MADVVKVSDIFEANKQLHSVLKHNKGRSKGQYKYVYISGLKKGYVVRLSQKKPTSKSARTIRKLH